MIASFYVYLHCVLGIFLVIWARHKWRVCNKIIIISYRKVIHIYFMSLQYLYCWYLWSLLYSYKSWYIRHITINLWPATIVNSQTIIKNNIIFGEQTIKLNKIFSFRTKVLFIILMSYYINIISNNSIRWFIIT